MQSSAPSRRSLLRSVTGLAAAQASKEVLVADRQQIAQVPWSAGSELPQTKAPPNATDCHHHIYDSRFPMDANAALRAGAATVADYGLLQKRIGIRRHVIIQPSSYGFDNRCLVDALTQSGSTARGIAVINPDVTESALRELDKAGVRGIRLTLSRTSITTIEMAQPLARRVSERGWHVQVNGSPELILAAIPVLSRLPVPVIFDHLAHAGAPGSPLFTSIARLLQGGSAWVKLSGAYIDSKSGPPDYSDSSTLAISYIKEAPQRCLWGTDWPHPSVKSKPDDALLFDLLARWTGNKRTFDQILVANPVSLFRFS